MTSQRSTTTQPPDDASPSTTSRRPRTTAKDPESIVEDSIVDIEAYWAVMMPDVYDKPYEPLAGGHHTFDERNRPPACGRVRPSYEDVAFNAFYCPDDDLIAVDTGQLVPALSKKFGAFAVAFVLAHEWGHAIQIRGGVSPRVDTVALEQQADCFAGAWARNVHDGHGERLEPQAGDLENGLAALIAFRDPPGSSPTSDGAHGSAFDRANAFQEGFDQGPQRCADYPTNPPVIVQMPFRSRADRASGGNYPYDPFTDQQGNEQPGAPEFAAGDLNAYFEESADEAGLTFSAPTVLAIDASSPPECGSERLSTDDVAETVVYCAADNYVGYDDEFTRDVYDEIGDFGVATLLAHEWGAAAQEQSGVDSGTDEAQLQDSCLMGAWTATLLDGSPTRRRDANMTLSPGDLDETLQALLAFSQPPDETGKLNAFSRIQSFRTGFFDGIESCR
jgi:predicted metalloprotease